MKTDITKQMEMVLYRTEEDDVTVSALIKDETDKALEELSDFNSISKNVGEEDAKAD